MGSNSNHITIICVITCNHLGITKPHLKTILALFNPFLYINMHAVMPIYKEI